MPSIFISFSGNDNPTWRQKFRSELERILRPAPGEIFYSEDDPVLSGSLPGTLKTAVNSSRLMISIIGTNYLKSRYCALELTEFFAVPENEEPERKQNFIAIFLNRDTFNEVDSWEVWKNAGLSDIAKIHHF
jgi:TIR domain